MSESKLSMTPPASPAADISLCFIGLPDADRATFERVVSFCAAKGQHFRITSDTSANILVTDDNDSAIELLFPPDSFRLSGMTPRRLPADI